MKTLKTFIPVIILLGFFFLWQGCTKKDQANSTDFFEKDDLSFFKSANGELAKVDFLDKTIERFKILDQRQHFVANLEAKYGAAKWDVTMVVRNKDGLYTLITPFIDFNDSVKALLFSYHSSNAKTIYTVYNSENYKEYFDYSGDKNAKTINRSTIEGLFKEFGSKNQLLRNIKEGRTQARAIIISWVCWYYTWQYGTDGVGVSNEQCSYSIHDTGGGGGGTPSGGDAGGVTIDQDQPENPDDRGGGTTETWTYEEKPSPNQIIIDSLQGYKCAQDLLGSIGNLNDSVSKILNGTFGESNIYNLIFVPRSNEELRSNNGEIVDGRFLNAEKVWPSETSDEYKVNYTVGINTDVLNNATQEYILVTMYHEGLHAFLSYKNVQLGDSVFKATYPKIKTYDVVSPNGKRTRKFDLIDDHERFGVFINLLEQSIKSFNKNMPPDRVTAMARMGIIDPSAITNEQKLLNGYERNTTEGNSVGTKCPPLPTNGN